MKKCKYYNNSKTTVSLMIDDFSLTATTINGEVKPDNDWGYSLNKENSLYLYMEKNLLNKYPEIKGTIFFPIHKHAAQNIYAGYQVLFGEYNDEFKDFVNYISKHFDFSFHGTTHGKFINEKNPSFKNWKNEFEYLTLDDIAYLKMEISKIEDYLGFKFSGGKYPGYKKNKYSEAILEALGMKWWCSECYMINKKLPENRHTYFGKQNRILDLPTNLSGNIYNENFVSLNSSIKFWQKVKKIIGYKTDLTPSEYISYLYENQIPITIQEHFQNKRTDGIRQTPNIFDDLNSLDRIYGTLRGADVWHATCSEIAYYLESYDTSEIIKKEDSIYEIKYNGSWGIPFLSVYTKNREILHLDTGNTLKGVYKNGYWIFNKIPTGSFKLLGFK